MKCYLALAVAMWGLSACGQSSADAPASVESASASAASAVVQTVVPAKNLLEDDDALQAAQTRLQQLPYFAGKPVYVFGNIEFFDGVQPRIELTVQSPHQADELWFLRYEHGQWQAPEPDETPKDELPKPLTRYLTPLQEIHFTDVTHVAQLWRTKAAEVNAVWQEPYHVAFIWMPKLKKRFWHTAELDAVGAQYYLSVNLDGTIWEWKKL